MYCFGFDLIRNYMLLYISCFKYYIWSKSCSFIKIVIKIEICIYGRGVSSSFYSINYSDLFEIIIIVFPTWQIFLSPRYDKDSKKNLHDKLHYLFYSINYSRNINYGLFEIIVSR